MGQSSKSVVCISFACILVYAGLVAAPPARAEREPRTETHQYNASSGNSNESETNLTELTFSSRRSERLALVEIEDRAGGTVRAVVTQSAGGGRSYEVCGATDRPLRITGGREITVRIEGGCADGVAATSGRVTMTFFTSRAQVRGYMESRPPAEPRIERDLQATYYLSSAVAIGDSGTATYYGQIDGDEAVGGATFQATQDERFVSVSVSDTVSADVWAYVSYGPPGQFPTTRLAIFCNKTEEPVEFPAGSNVLVAVATGACDASTPSLPTTGTIDVTFSNVP